MKGVPVVKRILHSLLVVPFLLLPCLAYAEELMPITTDPAYGEMEFRAGEIIIELRKGISPANIQSLLLTEGVVIRDELSSLGLMLLSAPQGQELEKLEELKRNPLVEYAELNYVVRIAESITIEPHFRLRAPDVIPNDPYFPSQWNLPKMGAPAAWDITTGGAKVVIAFIDSGVDLDHAEFRDKVWTNTDEIPSNGVDDDGNGYVDDVQGWDFVNWDGRPQDDYGHGTFVASIAAVETNNGLGLAGVSWGTEIMSIKAFDKRGDSSHWHTAGGIEYAANNGANIINLSWSLNPDIDPQPLQAAINYAYSKGALVVAAAGDSHDDSYRYPAALEHVVSVAATNRDDGHPEFSTYNDRVDVAAPGADILGLCLGNVYCRFGSTHSAAAHVSGLVALVWSVNPTLTSDEVEDIIESTAVDQVGDPARDTPGWDAYFGHGRIDANAAVRATTHYLQVEPDNLSPFLICDGTNPSSQLITNPGTNSSTWSVTAIAPWLSVSPPEGYTPSSATVSVDKGGLPGYGVYTAPITATSTMTNYANNPRTITVTIIYPLQCWRNYLPLLSIGS